MATDTTIYVQSDILSKINPYYHQYIFETLQTYSSTDVLCEGPIEGLCDKKGNTVNYIKNSSNNDSVLQYGIYLNDVSVRDKTSNLLNFTESNFDIYLGNEVSKLKTIASTVYSYKNHLYDISKSMDLTVLTSASTAVVTNNYSEGQDKSPFITCLDSIVQSSNIFNHYVKNKYSTNFKLLISVDEAFYIGGKGDQYVNPISFGIIFTNLTKKTKVYFNFYGSVLVKGSSSHIPVYIDLANADINQDNEFLISVFSTSVRISGLDTNHFRKISIDSIIEYVNYNFSYPYSVVCKTQVSARHFNSIPVRSFDCKLLKIRIPENYDNEAREYYGSWSGNFDKALKWSDNPAWIFYDLCLNARYGLTRGTFTENDISKWEVLKISKYCDELVATQNPTKYFPASFVIGSGNKITINTSDSIDVLNLKYPVGNLLYIYGITPASVSTNYKKIILEVTTNGTTATLTLCNDFGVRKFLEYDKSGILLQIINVKINSDQYFNSQDKIKQFLIQSLIGAAGVSLTEDLLKRFKYRVIFDASLNITGGSCVAQQDFYLPYLEPRFSANILINNESQGLKILNDLTSIFRGMYYFQNGYLNISSDIKSSVSYIFSNSNVKDGLFTYATQTAENNYSTAKITYLDSNDNFKDKIVIVEDSTLVRKFGPVDKEILGFGATSKSQAKRLGRWFLATNKLESQLLSFSVGLEATVLKPGSIVRVADKLKNQNVVFGKISAIDNVNKFITIDRQIPENCAIKKIRIYSENPSYNSDASESTNELFFDIASVDNMNQNIYINDTYSNFSFIRSGTVFAIYLDDENSQTGDLYRIISIHENNVNEYSISAMKYSAEKFDIIEKDQYVDPDQYRAKQISFGSNNPIAAVNFSSADVSSFTSFNARNYIDIFSTSYDYSFFIEREYLEQDFAAQKYQDLIIDFNAIFNMSILLNNTSVSGVLCSVTRNGKILKFKVLKSNPKIIKICLGERPVGDANIAAYVIDFYTFNVNNQLFNV